MKKVRGLLGACAILFCSIVSAQVKVMPGGPRVNQLNLSEGVTHLRSVKMAEIQYYADGKIQTLKPYRD